MVECKVVFQGKYIQIGKYELRPSKDDVWDIYVDDEFTEWFKKLELAIQWCMEN